MIFVYARVIFLLTYITSVMSKQCSWNYRFDSTDNHFNIVYPDKNAVYFGMIIPMNSSEFEVVSNEVHPVATYFSIQIYEIGGIAYHYNDVDMVGSLQSLENPMNTYDLSIRLDSSLSYFALFRIYDSRINELSYWSGTPPITRIDSIEYPLCDIDYQQQGNIQTNFTNNIIPETGTVCIKNDRFVFMDIPAGSLANADANYMIACVESGASYKITMRLPILICSLDTIHPRIDDYYDVRYASLSIVSTNAPRPTFSTVKLPCDTTDFSVIVVIEPDMHMPGLLYRQLLPDPTFEYSIAIAKSSCSDDICVQSVMGEYYPTIERIT